MMTTTIRRSLARYQAEVRAAIFDVPGGLRPPEPETDAEIAWLCERFPDWARDMGFGQHVPLPREWRSRFVATLAADPEFRAAVADWIGGEA